MHFSASDIKDTPRSSKQHEQISATRIIYTMWNNTSHRCGLCVSKDDCSSYLSSFLFSISPRCTHVQAFLLHFLSVVCPQAIATGLHDCLMKSHECGATLTTIISAGGEEMPYRVVQRCSCNSPTQEAVTEQGQYIHIPSHNSSFPADAGEKTHCVISGLNGVTNGAILPPIELQSQERDRLPT